VRRKDQEDAVKRSTLWMITLLAAMALALAACVRPAPEGAQGAATAVPGGAATPLATAPSALLPSPTPLSVIATPTPLPIPTNPPTSQEGGTVTLPTNHVVQPGETLDSIAQRYGVSAAEIQGANVIPDPNNIPAGTVLVIPAPQVPQVVPTAAPPPSTGEQTHVVQPGENLFRIGLRYGFTAEELAAYNGISNMNLIFVGDVIRIPPK
jgi:LysM repeat protein